MVKEIELTKNNLARLSNTEPFLLPDDNLTICFKHGGYNLLSAFITIKNGSIVDKYKFEKIFAVPEKFLFVGRLEMQIDMCMDGEIVKTWKVLPIKILETDNGDFEFIELLADTITRKEFEDLKASVDKLLAQHKVTL